MRGDDKKVVEANKKACLSNLKGVISPHDTIYTSLESVSRSGMSRNIKLFVIKDNKPLHISYDTGKLLDYKQSKSPYYGIVVKGCGMDMGYSVVYNLASALFGDGYALKQQWL